MTPPAPLPEHDFEAFLKANDCFGERRGKEFAIYRKSDGKLISTYAVRHGSGKREVLHVYKANFPNRLNELSEMKKLFQSKKLKPILVTIGKIQNGMKDKC